MKIKIPPFREKIGRSLLHILFLLYLAILHSAQAQWQQVAMDGGTAAVLNFLASDSVQMVATPYNFYLSCDFGESWNRVDPFAASSVRLFSVTDSFWCVGSYSSGVYVTTDKGRTWQSRGSGGSGVGVGMLAADSKRIAFASSTGPSTLFVSDDRGENWQGFGTNVSGISVIEDTVIFTTPYYYYYSLAMQTGSRLSGYKFTGISTPGNMVFNYMATIGSTIFGGTSTTIYMQANRSAAWKNITKDLPNPDIKKFYTHASELYVLNGSSIFKFEIDVNDSIRWSKQFDIPAEIKDVQIGSGYLLGSASSYNGILKSTDNGVSWYPTNKGLGELAGGDFFSKDSLLLATVETKGLMSTTDGLNWKLYSPYLLSQFCFHKGYLFAYASGVYRSSDLGVTWENKTSGITVSYKFGWKLSSNDSFIVCGTWAGGVFLSTDAGDSWKDITSNVSADMFGFCYIDNGYIYLGSSGGVISRSSNHGASWSRVTLRGLSTWAMRRHGNTLYLGTSNGIYQSEDGATWDYSSHAGVNVDHLMITDSFMVATGYGNGIGFSSDLGKTWKSVQNNLPSYSLSDIALYQGKIYVTTNSAGIWFRGIEDMYLTNVHLNNNYPATSVLFHNFPNPFNPATTIRYSLPSRSRVRLIIVNTLGQQIADLENGEREAGLHEVQWRANVASGIYFYHIEATPVANPSRHFVDTKKMLLLK